MIFSSSPVLYPPSSSPPPILQKRKLFQTFQHRDISPKRPKILGGFILDEGSDDDEEEEEAPNDSRDTRLDTIDEGQVLRSVDPNVRPDIEISRGVKDKQGQEEKSANTSLSTPLPIFSSRLTPKNVEIQTSSGQKIKIANRTRNVQQSYEQIIAERSAVAPGRAKKAYYGIDIHGLIDEAKMQAELSEAAAEYKRQNQPAKTIEQPVIQCRELSKKSGNHQMWTEKYRAKKFTDLVGDERTHRTVLRWLKSWDQIVFPGNSKVKTRRIHEDQEQQQHRKIMLLTGPPGLGKTTLAHVCAKQAGYEVLEINASDDRSRDVVKGRIKDALGTETVRGVQETGKARRAGRPVCVIVDEVDGVVTGSGGSGGEGGFMKALIDLVQLDQRNSSGQEASSKGKKGDRFRLMRPLILICNDVYAPSLRPLRQSSLAEIVHVRKPSIEKVILRLRHIFDRENIGCDNDAVRRLCESSWGLGTRKQNSLGGRGAGDGDIRGILVQGEWIAHKLRASDDGEPRLTRKWVEENVDKSSASHDGLGRGGIREVAERIFVEGAGLPNLPTALSKDEARIVSESKSNPIGVADLRKRSAINALRGMIDTTGDHDRLMTECFTTYPTQIYQDDTLLSKPNASYEWLHFHDTLSSKIFSGQEWELNPYLSTSACGFHDLFAAVDKGPRGWNEEKVQNDDSNEDNHPFSGPKADFAAYEAEKANRIVLTEMQSGFSAPMLRLFSSVDTIATELVSSVSQMLAPEVKPVVVGGSGSTASVASVRKENEKNCIQHAVKVMHNLGIEFEKIKIESESFGAHANGGYALRMEPPLDLLSTFHISKPAATTTTATTTTSSFISTNIKPAPVRYAIRQVLSQELYKEKAHQAALARQARASGLSTSSLSTHPAISSSSTDTTSLQNIEQLTAIATATATLTSAPGSTTVLGPTITTTIKKDFFGRPITTTRPGSHGRPPSAGTNTGPHTKDSQPQNQIKNESESAGQRIWVSFHEGYSNAVRKYISLAELMDGF